MFKKKDWKALDEICKIYMLLHRSDLNISEFFRQIFSYFSAKFEFFFEKIVIFEFFSVISAPILMKFCRNFADIFENVENFRIFSIFQRKFLNFARILTELRSE